MKFWFHKEPAERQAQEIERIFRSTFSTEDGKICFTILLEDLKFFDTANTVEAMALKNYATVLLKRLGNTDSYKMATMFLERQENK